MDTGTSRRRTPDSKHNRRRGNADSSDVGSQGPYGLRKAYTVGGEIVVNQVNSENEQGTSSSRDPYDKTHYDEDGGEYQEDFGHNRNVFRRATIWKRLGWPISLTQAAIAKWKENRERKGRPKRKPPQMRNMGEGPDQTLPMHSIRNNGDPPLSPAAQFAADARSAPPAQSSVRSVAHSAQSSVPPPLPPKTPTPKSTGRVPEVDLASSVQAVDPNVEANDVVMTDTKDNEQDLKEPGSLTAEVPLPSESTV